MSALTHAVRKLLALEPGAQLVLTGQVDRPQRLAGLGKSGLGKSFLCSAALIELRERLAAEPFRTPVSWHHEMAHCRLAWWDPDPGVVILGPVEVADVRVAGPHLQLSAHEWALDGRYEDVWARMEDLLLQCSGGDLKLFMVTVARWAEPGEVPEIPAPDLSELSSGLKLETWLVALAGDMSQSPRAVTRVAAAGLVARLWSCADSDSRRTAWERLRSNQDGPATKAVRWFHLLTPPAREHVQRSALHEVDALEDRLPELSSGESADAAVLGVSWLHRRDDLECLRFLCKRTDTGAELERALSALDERASGHHDFWKRLSLQDDERLWSVSWQEPESWWGQLVAREAEREQ
jgi:hypothetical protein